MGCTSFYCGKNLRYLHKRNARDKAKNQKNSTQKETAAAVAVSTIANRRRLIACGGWLCSGQWKRKQNPTDLTCSERKKKKNKG